MVGETGREKTRSSSVWERERGGRRDLGGEGEEGTRAVDGLCGRRREGEEDTAQRRAEGGNMDQALAQASPSELQLHSAPGPLRYQPLFFPLPRYTWPSSLSALSPSAHFTQIISPKCCCALPCSRQQTRTRPARRSHATAPAGVETQTRGGSRAQSLPVLLRIVNDFPMRLLRISAGQKRAASISIPALRRAVSTKRAVQRV